MKMENDGWAGSVMVAGKAWKMKAQVKATLSSSEKTSIQLNMLAKSVSSMKKA